jgi:hypothetical protein
MSLSPDVRSVAVSCENCGAPLRVSDAVRFVTCVHCHSRLEIVRSPSHLHARLLEDIHEQSADAQASLQIIELQNEVERLDREWEAWREQNYGRGKGGTLQTTPSQSVSGFAALLLFAGSFLALAGWMNRNWWMVAVSPLLFFACSKLFRVAADCRSEEEAIRLRFHVRRRTLLESIERLRRQKTAPHAPS